MRCGDGSREDIQYVDTSTAALSSSTPVADATSGVVEILESEFLVD